VCVSFFVVCLGFYKCFSSNIEKTFGTTVSWELPMAGWNTAQDSAARNSLGSLARLQKHCTGNTRTATAVRQLI